MSNEVMRTLCLIVSQPKFTITNKNGGGTVPAGLCAECVVRTFNQWNIDVARPAFTGGDNADWRLKLVKRSLSCDVLSYDSISFVHVCFGSPDI